MTTLLKERMEKINEITQKHNVKVIHINDVENMTDEEFQQELDRIENDTLILLNHIKNKARELT